MILEMFLKFPELFGEKASCKPIIIRSYVTSSQIAKQQLICPSSMVLFCISASSLEFPKLFCTSQSLQKVYKMTAVGLIPRDSGSVG